MYTHVPSINLFALSEKHTLIDEMTYLSVTYEHYIVGEGLSKVVFLGRETVY